MPDGTVYIGFSTPRRPGSPYTHTSNRGLCDTRPVVRERSKQINEPTLDEGCSSIKRMPRSCDYW